MNITIIGVIALIFLGEALAIYAEMKAAHTLNEKSSFLNVFKVSFFLILIGGAFLIAGYTFGYQSLKNIWMVSAISITSILIIEPVLAYSIFHEVPTRGAFIGLLLGALGFIATLSVP